MSSTEDVSLWNRTEGDDESVGLTRKPNFVTEVFQGQFYVSPKNVPLNPTNRLTDSELSFVSGV